MYNFNKIGIPIDDSELYKTQFNACQLMNGSILDVKEIHIIHVFKADPTEKRRIKKDTRFNKAYEETKKKHEEVLRKKLKKRFGNKFQDKLYVHLLIGSPVEEVLKFQEEQKMDLFLIGKKNKFLHSGRFQKEVIRRGNTPVLIIPERFNKKWQLKDILVPHDFSTFSNKALLAALDIRPSVTEHKVECFHVIDAPFVASEMITTTEHFIEFLKKERKEAFQKNLKMLKIKEDIDFKVYDAPNKMTSRAIRKRARKGKFSLIVMAAQSHSSFERFFLGSVTEKTISRNKRIPILVIQ